MALVEAHQASNQRHLTRRRRIEAVADERRVRNEIDWLASADLPPRKTIPRKYKPLQLSIRAAAAHADDELTAEEIARQRHRDGIARIRKLAELESID